eukprot:TRINITY_DN1246_c2_g1_i1.p1 TRINITY_DN1246_c2_g1~~TRINITY_DN1246_c2_g1_i1.p1  ORF type:complete len:1201 (+),score=329.76 TRINITY_DN1246_c2_g1_i1:76-3678(+)
MHVSGGDQLGGTESVEPVQDDSSLGVQHSTDDLDGDSHQPSFHTTGNASSEPADAPGPTKIVKLWMTELGSKRHFKTKRNAEKYCERHLKGQRPVQGQHYHSAEFELCSCRQGVEWFLNRPGLYEGMDQQQTWWPVTLLTYNQEMDRFSAKVHDGTVHGKLWEVVVPSNVRGTRDRDYRKEGCGYNSKQETGFVGLKNQGATCYLNALLQCLFQLSYFKTGIYKMDTESEHEVESDSKFIPLALQKLFYALEFQDEPPATTELTKSFGWGQRDVSTQHDIQELMRVLLDTLSDKMQQSGGGDTIKKLFRGELVYYTRCTDTEHWKGQGMPVFESRRVQEFYDIALVIQGTSDIKSSFRKYCEQDVLDGENQYEVELDGKKSHHPAIRGCIFRKLPPVLIIHLRRFDYCLRTLRQIKICDQWSFESDVDLTEFVEPDSGADAVVDGEASAQKPESTPPDRDIRREDTTDTLHPTGPVDNRYELHSVMVHSGSIDFGHYYCYVRTDNGEDWLKFDDTTVYHVSESEAIEGTFGSDKYMRHSNSSAYLLIYIRKGEADQIVYPPREDERPLHLKRRFEAAKREEKLKEEERIERQRYVTIFVCTEATIEEYVQKNVGSVCSKAATPAEFKFKMLRTQTVGALKDEIERRGGPARNFCRVWSCKTKHGDYDRPGWVLGDDESSRLDGDKRRGDFELFVFAEHRPDGTHLTLPHPTVQGLLNVKVYDPTLQPPMRSLGCFIVLVYQRGTNPATCVQDVINWANEKLGRAAGSPMAVWEERDPEQELVLLSDKPTQALHKGCGIGTGGVAVVQPCSADARAWLHSRDASSLEIPESLADTEHPHPQRFYDHETMFVDVCMLELPADSSECPPVEKGVMVTVRRSDTYPALQEALAKKLGADVEPATIRFTRHSTWSEGPESTSAKTTDGRTVRTNNLSFLYAQDKSTTFRIYYEVLGQAVTAVEAQVSVSVEVRDAVGKVLRKEASLLMPSRAACTNLAVCEAALKSVSGTISRDPRDYHILSYSQHCLQRVYLPTEEEVLDTVAQHTYRIEPLVGEGEIVPCVHMAMETDRPALHSEPFVIGVLATDTIADAKEKMRKRLGLIDDEGASTAKDDGKDWPVHVYSDWYCSTHQVTPEDCVLDRMKEVRERHRAEPQSAHLAIEHTAPAARYRRRYQSQREEAIKFRSSASTANSSPKNGDKAETRL